MRILWPIAKDSGVWRTLERDVVVILMNAVKGKAESRVNIFSKLTYKCLSRFGQAGERAYMPKAKSKDIPQVVKERRVLLFVW